MTNDGLVAFLRERLAEDREAAQDAADRRGSGVWAVAERAERHWGDPEPDWDVLAGGKPVLTVDEEYGGYFVAAHVERFDPARVLAEVDAKRRILDVHEPREYLAAIIAETRHIDTVCRVCATFPEDETLGGDRFESFAHEDAPCLTLRLLAVPYAQHPAYRKEWTP